MSILDNLDKLSIELRDYQKDMLVALSESQSKRTIMQMETGTGKTIVFGAYAILRAVLNNKRALIIVCSEELLDQTVDKFKMMLPDIDIGRFIGSHRDYDSQVVVGSLQTIKNLHNLIVMDDDFEVIIYDEAHHATSPTSKRVFYRYGVCDLDTAGHHNVELIAPHISDTRELIGVTATPERTDETPLGLIFHDRIDGPTIEWFIKEGHLCDLKFLNVETGVDLSDVRTYIGDFSETDIAKNLQKSGFINEISRVIEEYASDRKSILLYMPDVATTIIAATAIQEAGISCDYVTGAERKRRAEVIGRFKRGEIRVLVNCLVLKEGFDAPNADCILLCRPTKSPPLLKQIIGRLTRPFEGKDKGLFIDLSFKRRQNDIINASSIFEQSDLQESEQEDLSIKERIELQVQKSEWNGRLAHILDRIIHKKKLEGAGEPDPESGFSRPKPDKSYFEDVPDSVKLLVDTRILSRFLMSFSEFDTLFKEEMWKIRKVQDSPWMYEKEATEDQLIELNRMTDISHDDLKVMSWIEAKALANVIRYQVPPTKEQLVYIKYRKWVGEEPKTKRQAQDIINKLNRLGKYRNKRFKPPRRRRYTTRGRA